MILQFNMNKALYQVLYINITPAILYSRFMEQMNKGNIVKKMYSWEKRDSVGMWLTHAHIAMLLAVLEFKVVSISSVSIHCPTYM